MPATTNSLKDLMCYQIKKFEKTSVKTEAEPEASDSGLSTEFPSSSESEAGPFAFGPLAIHNYQNILPNPLNTPQPRKSSRCPCGKLTTYLQHYCKDCERETKRSRTRMFGSGGQVLVDKNHGYANAAWASFDEPPPEILPRRRNSQQISRSSSSCSVGSSAGSHISSVSNRSSGSGSNLRISVNLPASLDFDYMLKSQRFSINISITETKNANPGVPTELAFIQSQRDLLALTGWYYQRVDWQESIRILQSTPVGTFFLRDSGDPRYLFSLSVQTPYGPISSRISYSAKKFRLDSQEKIANLMPSFSTIIELIEHYTKFGLVKHASGRQVWVDSSGHTFSPVQLTRPRRKEVGTLKHLARISVNEHRTRLEPQLNSTTRPIPAPIKSYLAEYPYTF